LSAKAGSLSPHCCISYCIKKISVELEGRSILQLFPHACIPRLVYLSPGPSLSQLIFPPGSDPNWKFNLLVHVCTQHTRMHARTHTNTNSRTHVHVCKYSVRTHPRKQIYYHARTYTHTYKHTRSFSTQNSSYSQKAPKYSQIF